MSGAVVLSCSGGKDSTATGLYLQEQGIPFEAIFCDTGWEHPATYEYLRGPLTARFGQIRELSADVRWPERVRLHVLRASGAPMAEVDAAERAEGARLAEVCEGMAREIEALLDCGGAPSPLVRVALRKSLFPARDMRWCTQELKAIPARTYLATLDDPLNAVGIRAEESRSRALMPEREYDAAMDCEVWRPIIRWTLDDVIAIHARHGLRPNPLYLGSAVRVGCYPCIFARKAEIAELDSGRLAAIRLLERHVSSLCTERFRRHGRTETMPSGTFFKADKPNPDGSYAYPIDKVMEWAKTGRGGRQYELFAAGREEGCMRWGLCNTGRLRRVPVEIRPWNYKPRRARLDPYRHLFGILPDREIARRCGVASSVVRDMRRRSGVAPYTPPGSDQPTL
jgi:3'-phosphoadenosine 5'-phosphosulfate sulfotransferase (PAPS reductase)/FAD synthetase